MNSIIGKSADFLGRRNVAPKAGSILLAIMLWAFVNYTKGDKLTFRVPVQERDLPGYFIISQMPEKHVLVTLEGRRDHLKNFNIKNIELYVDLRHPVPGEFQRYPIEVRKDNVPENISVSLSLRDLPILVEKKEEKRLRVIPRVAMAPEGIIVTSAEADPSFVTAYGPRSALNALEAVYTDDIPLELEPGTFERAVGLRRYTGNRIQFADRTIRVRISTREYNNAVAIDVPIEVRNPEKDMAYELDISHVRVYFASKGRVSPRVISEAWIDASRVDLQEARGIKKNRAVYKEAPVTAIIRGAPVLSVVPSGVVVKISKRR